MPFNTPQETAEAAVVSGTAKSVLDPSKALVGGSLAGAYIAFGGLLAIIVTAGLKADQGRTGSYISAIPVNGSTATSRQRRPAERRG